MVDKSFSIDAHLKSMEQEAHFRGAVIVKKKGEILLSKAYGEASKQHKNTPSTIFHIGSLTKQFTAAAILQLNAYGKIDLDASITQYLPKYDSWDKVTVRHLLGHTSGIPNYTDWEDYIRITKSLTPRKIIERASRQDLYFRPGSEFAYSNTGYIILGALIEEQSGQSYGTYLKDNIFGPAGMKSSGVHDEHFETNSKFATGYCLNNTGEGLIEDHAENISATFSDGAVYSTVDDLAIWSDVLDGKGGILSDQILKMMKKPGIENYGYGLEIDKKCGEKWIHHNGSIAGFNSDFCKYPDHDLTFIILSNNLNFETQHVSGEVARLFFKNEPMTVVKPFSEDFDLSLYLGIFESENDGFEFYITREGRLFIDGRPPSECLLLSNDRVYNPSLGLEFALKRGGDSLALYDGYNKELETLYFYD